MERQVFVRFIARPPRVFCPCNLLVEIDEDGGEDEHGDGERGAHRPVARLHEFILDQVAQQQGLAAAQQVRDEEQAHRRHEHQHAPRHNARHRQRHRHREEGLKGRSAQVARGLHNRPIQLLHGVVDGGDHEGEQGVHHAQHHRAVVVEDLERLVDDPHGLQGGVEPRRLP